MDPMSAAAAASAVFVMKDAASKVLGPTFDLYGEELRRINEDILNRRRKNVGRIFTKAEKKLGERINDEGSVHPKVLKEILDDGSYAEEELAAEYFGGVLASSRTGVNRDDRGAVFAKMVGRLSVYQLRTHYILYTSVKEMFTGRPLKATEPVDRQDMQILIPLNGYSTAMELGKEESMDAILNHVLFGLAREALIDGYSMWGTHCELQEDWEEAPSGGLLASPSSLGVELFLWAHGQGHMEIPDFLKPELTFELDMDIPKTEGVIIRHPPGQEISHRSLR